MTPDVAGKQEEPQDRLVRDFCREAQVLIRMAGSESEAMRIKEEECGRFQKECDSMLLVHAARQYLDDMIKEQWGSPWAGSTVSWMT